MANIRNYISMTDQMTPTLRSIVKSLDSTLRVMKQLDKASNQGIQSRAYRRAEEDIRKANNQLIKMGNYNKLISKTAQDGERSYRRMSSAVSSASNNVRSLTARSSSFVQTLASGVYLAKQLAHAMSNVMNTADASRSQVARLGLYNTSKYSNEALYGQVFSAAMGTRSGLTDTADLANKILISGVYSGQNAAQAAIGTAGLINKALVAGGGTSEENQRSLRQLTQGLASGVLQGDELRSIREQTPYFAQVLAEGLAQVDERFKGIGIGDLKRLGAEGELTSERVIKAMWAMQDEIDKDFGAMPKTFGQATTSLKNLGQYFLWMLSSAEGPLARINDKMWELVEYLQSPGGLELMEGVAAGIDALSKATIFAADCVGEFVVFLQENSDIAQACFIALGVAAVASAVACAVSWIAATWPLLLLVGAVGLVIWAFLNAGYTAEQVVGAIVGGVLAVVAVIWDAVIVILDIVLWLLGFIAIGVVGLVAGIILALQGVIQVVLWIVNAILTAILALWTGIETLGLFILGIAQTVGQAIVNRVYDTVTTVLGLLGTVASVIDTIFGTNLSGTVEVWTSKVDHVYSTVSGYLDAGKTFGSIGDLWKQFGEDTADRWSVGSDWNITDNMANTWGTTGNLIDGVLGLVGAGEDALGGLLVDPSKWYNAGSQWGSGMVGNLNSMNIGLPDGSILSALSPDGIEVNGGYLDGIKSDVDINEEDLRLLRDMAARDFLLQLQTITPVANVTFGDVRETADVGRIVEVIEQMVDEQMATSLVG